MRFVERGRGFWDGAALVADLELEEISESLKNQDSQTCVIFCIEIWVRWRRVLCRYRATRAMDIDGLENCTQQVQSIIHQHLTAGLRIAPLQEKRQEPAPDAQRTRASSQGSGAGLMNGGQGSRAERPPGRSVPLEACPTGGAQQGGTAGDFRGPGVHKAAVGIPRPHHPRRIPTT